MKIILTEQCESFTGSLGRGFGYHIQRRKNGFFAKRNTKGSVPFNGHWLFIVACAQMAKAALHIVDILVSAKELREAINEAGFLYGDKLATAKNNEIFHASQVLDFKKRWLL